MKGLKAVLLVILTLLSLCAFPACNKEEENGEEEFTPLPEGTLSFDERCELGISFFVDWCDGGKNAEISVIPDSRGVYDYYSKTLANRGRQYYIYQGIYTEKNGQGQKVFNTAGAYLLRTNGIQDGTTFYAYWKPVDVVICYNLSTATKTTFLDGSKKKTVRVTYEGELPIEFPDVVCEVGEFRYWSSPCVAQISDGNLLRNGQEKVAGHLNGGGFATSGGTIQSVPQPTTVYGEDPLVILNLTPVIDYQTHVLTLDFGSGQVSRHELKYGTPISNYLSVDDFNGRELVGWATHPTETQNFVTEESLTEDMTLYAIWKNYRTVRFHTLNGEIVEKHVYQYETHYLSAPEARDGYVFSGWYASADFETPVSRIISYTGTTTDYYAKWLKEKIGFTIEWPTLTEPQKYNVKLTQEGTYPAPKISTPYRSGETFIGVFTETNGRGTQVYDRLGNPLVDEIADGTALYSFYMLNSTHFRVYNGARYLHYTAYLDFFEGEYGYVGSINTAHEFVDSTHDPRFMKLVGFVDDRGNMAFDANGAQVVPLIGESQIFTPKFEPVKVTFVYLLPEGCTLENGAPTTEVLGYLDELSALPGVISENGTLMHWLCVESESATTGSIVSNGTTPLLSANAVEKYNVQYNSETNTGTVYLLAVITPAAGGEA